MTNVDAFKNNVVFKSTIDTKLFFFYSKIDCACTFTFKIVGEVITEMTGFFGLFHYFTA